MSRRKYTIRREAGLHLTDRRREMLGTAWNGYVNRCARISLRHFARVHNIPYATWQRELRRGAASPILRRGNRWTYPEYDIDKARADPFYSAQVPAGSFCTAAPTALPMTGYPSEVKPTFCTLSILCTGLQDGFDFPKA